jgi:hypothetical protein
MRMARFQDSLFRRMRDRGGQTRPAEFLYSTTTTLMDLAYNAAMLRTHNPLVHISTAQHARVCFVLAVILFLLAAWSVYANESAHYHIYLALGLVFAVLGIAPLVMHALQGKSK